MRNAALKSCQSSLLLVGIRPRHNSVHLCSSQ